MSEKNQSHECLVCGQKFLIKNLIPMGAIRKSITEEISHDFPEWSPQSYICQADLTKYRIQYVHSLLKSEKGEVTDLEYEVIKSLQQHEVITKNVENQLDQNWTLGERLADKIATFGGSWAFLMCFATFLAIWIIVNTVVMVTHPADPYPFILLNLFLSMTAALQAPLILMSQNRSSDYDRLHADNDFHVNLKTEEEMRVLHAKIDRLIQTDYPDMLEVQALQTKMLGEMQQQLSALNAQQKNSNP